MSTEMTPQASIAGRLSRETRIAILWVSAVLIALAAALVPPVAQPESYHAFADQRSFLGIANFLDVASNLAFLVVGLMGLYFVLAGRRSDGSPAFQDASERWAWGVVFAATALTCCGSGYYHLAPDSPRLAWDRLPMAVGFMGIVAAAVSERISFAAGGRLLAPLALLGVASVSYWRWSAVHRVENLNPYGAVQFGSALIVLLIIALFPPRYTRGADFFTAVALYALAKAAEHFDRQIFAATSQVVSGHTLKHLLAALAIFWLLRMLKLRVPLGPART